MCINQTTKEDETRSLFVEKEILTLTLCINSPTYNIVVLMVARDTCVLRKEQNPSYFRKF